MEKPKSQEEALLENLKKWREYIIQELSKCTHQSFDISKIQTLDFLEWPNCNEEISCFIITTKNPFLKKTYSRAFCIDGMIRTTQQEDTADKQNTKFQEYFETHFKPNMADEDFLTELKIHVTILNYKK